jgi:hypothetical protein
MATSRNSVGGHFRGHPSAPRAMLDTSDKLLSGLDRIVCDRDVGQRF